MDMANLIKRCLARDRDGIQELVIDHQLAVFRLCLSILDNSAEADEATQDVFISALSSLDTFRGDSDFTTWLHRITVNLCRNRLRKRRAKERLFRTLQVIFRFGGVNSVHPEETVIQHEADYLLRKAVNTLGEKHRLPIILHYYHDFSVAEIAQILDIKEGTVLSRLFTARERLRSDLNGRLSFNHEVEENDRD
jgi:RNA polymerase sigma-70 factor (ECF subfamily)